MTDLADALRALVARWRAEAAKHEKHGDCYRKGEGWGLAECADDLDAILATVGGTAGNHYGASLTVAIEDSALVIRIGVQTLAHAVSYAEWANPWDEEAQDYIRTFAITDAVQFAEDVKRALLAEEEDGSSLLSDVLDTASEGAVDDGSEACEYEQRIPTGTTAASETWATMGAIPHRRPR
jgi:hypothetical protein